MTVVLSREEEGVAGPDHLGRFFLHKTMTWVAIATGKGFKRPYRNTLGDP
jgi:hypothetical protein